MFTPQEALDVVRLLEVFSPEISVETLRDAANLRQTQVYLKQAFDLAAKAGAKAIYLDSHNNQDGEIYLRLCLENDTEFDEIDVEDLESDESDEGDDVIQELREELSQWRQEVGDREILLSALNQWMGIAEREVWEQSVGDETLQAVFESRRRQNLVEELGQTAPVPARRPRRPRG